MCRRFYTAILYHSARTSARLQEDFMAQKRKHNRCRILRDNEVQRPDGRYMFSYYSQKGEKKYVYSWRLTENDKMPQGKRDDISLREKEKQITEDKVHGVDTSKSKVTLTEVFE